MVNLSEVHQLIGGSSESQLRAVLHYLCHDSDTAQEAQHLFLKVGAGKAAPKGQLAGTKRSASQLQICVRCKEGFDPEDNPKKSCLYHDGELEVDDEMFVDHDERCHGPMDTKENRRDYPENFIWTCCDKDGTEEGCVPGRHRAAEDKKARYDPNYHSSGGETETDASEEEESDESEEEEE